MKDVDVDTENVASAVELIECATALGMQVRSPVGVTVYIVHYYLDQETVRFVGVFVDEAKAKIALTEEIIQWWRRCEFLPWFNSYSDGQGVPPGWEEGMSSFLEEKKVEGILSFLKSRESRCGTEWGIVESVVR